MRVALISCGYADGLPRACSNRGRVLIRGQRAPLVGTVSMDMAMADVSHLPEVEPGDEVVILGRQASDEISLDEFAESAGMIPHELLVSLGSRAWRIYVEHGQPVACASLAADDLEPVDAETAPRASEAAGGWATVPKGGAGSGRHLGW
jgi:alanine racemase